MSDCQTKLDDIKKNCNDLYKSSCQDNKINPEFGTCYYNGKTAYILDKPDSNQLYSGSTRCYRGQLINTQDGLQMCPGTTGQNNSELAYFNCTFVSDTQKTINIFIIISIVVAVLLILIYYLYIRKRN